MSFYDQKYYNTTKFTTYPSGIIQSVIDELLKVIQLHVKKPLKSVRVLDIGCGNGEYDLALSKYVHSVVGVEPYKDIYNLAIKNKKKKYTNVRFINSLIEDYKTEEKFDLAISLTTVEHMPQVKKSFKQVFKLLNKGGVIYLTAPNKLWPYENHYRLYFLSWLPLPLANIYVRLFKRGDTYEDSAYSRSYFGMKRIFDKFPCTYAFVLPYNLNSAYIGCGETKIYYTLIKKIGIALIRKYNFFWIFSKGFIMIIKKK